MLRKSVLRCVLVAADATRREKVVDTVGGCLATNKPGELQRSTRRAERVEPVKRSRLQLNVLPNCKLVGLRVSCKQIERD